MDGLLSSQKVKTMPVMMEANRLDFFLKQFNFSNFSHFIIVLKMKCTLIIVLNMVYTLRIVDLHSCRMYLSLNQTRMSVTLNLAKMAGHVMTQYSRTRVYV